MTHHKKIYKLLFLFIILFYSLLIYECYATEEQNKCTCEIGKSLCSRCLDDFSLYFPNQNIDQIDVLDITSSPIEDKNENIKSCENCEENLMKFYFMGKKKLCSRCTLEYLSFHFSSQNIESLQSDCAEIIFDYIDDKNKFKLTQIKKFVDEKFEKESELLKKRKNKNQRFNLFVIANEILKILKQNVIKRRKCKVCSQKAFHFIKVPCCENFMCMKCLLTHIRKKSNQKCSLCEKEYLCRNVHEFSKMFKSTCVAIREICSLEITKEKEEEWKNEIMKMKKIKQNGNMRMQIKKFKEIIEAHEDYAINLIERDHLFDTEAINKNSVKKLWINRNWDIIIDVVIYFLQLVISPISFGNFGKRLKWLILNNLVAQGFAFMLTVPKIFTKEYRSNEISKKTAKTSQDFNRYFLTLINFLLALFFGGPEFFEHYSLIGFMIYQVPLSYWISQRVSKYIHSAAIHESFYEFY